MLTAGLLGAEAQAEPLVEGREREGLAVEGGLLDRDLVRPDELERYVARYSAWLRAKGCGGGAASAAGRGAGRSARKESQPSLTVVRSKSGSS